MSRTLPEWIGATDDTPAPARVRWRLFYAYGGVCPICTRSMSAGQWDLDHIKPLIDGGLNNERNLQPVCRSPCHRDKTRADVGRKSRAYKVSAEHVGAKRKRRTITAWRRFDGTIVRARKNR